MKKAIVIGATSGLGREIVMNLVREGWVVGIAGRRVELLEELANEMNIIIRSVSVGPLKEEDNMSGNGEVVYERIDVTTEDAVEGVERLVERLGGMDLFVNVAGVGFQNPTLDHSLLYSCLRSSLRIKSVNFLFFSNS